MANNIRAVSPSLFFVSLCRCLLVFLCLSPFLSISLGSPCLPLFTLTSLFPQAFFYHRRRPSLSTLASFRERVCADLIRVRWFTDTVSNNVAVATYPGTRHPEGRRRLLLVLRGRKCCTKVAFLRCGGRGTRAVATATAMAAFVRRVGKKGVIRGLLNALLVRYK